MARKKKTVPLLGKASAKRHLSPRAGRGRPRAARAGEGAVLNAERVDAPPHPARGIAAARHPLPASGERDAAALYRLMAWLSPAYPVGAFSYSSGVEWAVEAGDVTNAASLQDWLGVILTDGGGYCDAVLFAHMHRATVAGDGRVLRAVAELAAALPPSKERHLETTAQGAAFVEATRAAWPCAALNLLNESWDGPVAYPIAVAVAAAGHGIAVEPALSAYVQAVAANLVSAGVRLIPLGQSDGQRVLAALERLVADTVRKALACPLDDIGGAAFRADLASLRHETQYTRLFRS